MAYITLDKTWSAVSTVVDPVLYPTLIPSSKQCLYLLKQAFVTAGWVVTQSSDSINVGSSGNLPADRWITSANLINATPPTAHSWIVLKNTAIGTNFSICIDYNVTGNVGGSLDVCTIAISYGGYQAGTIQNRPVVNVGFMEQVYSTVSFVSPSTWNQNTGYAVLYSSDGECIRIFSSRDGTGKNYSSSCGFILLIEKLKNPAGWLDYNYVSIVSGTTTGSSLGFSYTNLCAAIPTSAKSEQNGVSISVGVATLSVASTFGSSASGSSFPDYDGRYMLTECYAMSASTSFPGLMGQFYDMYFTGSNIPEGMYIPTNTDVAGLVKLGQGVFGCSGNKVSIP
jgi:hypothetical protein